MISGTMTRRRMIAISAAAAGKPLKVCGGASLFSSWARRVSSNTPRAQYTRCNSGCITAEKRADSRTASRRRMISLVSFKYSLE